MMEKRLYHTTLWYIIFYEIFDHTIGDIFFYISDHVTFKKLPTLMMGIAHYIFINYENCHVII